MVFILPLPGKLTRLNAYLLYPLSETDLQYFKQRFELGACSRFNPALELVIKHAPDSYKKTSHAEIRRAETAAGRDDAFVLIDERASQSRDGAAWYVTDFADEELVDSGMAASNDVLLEILVKTSMLAITNTNEELANLTVEEELTSCGVETPFQVGFEQPEVYGREEDESSDDGACVFFTDAEVVAEPGDFEETTDSAVLDNMRPRPDVAVRLKEEVARSGGLLFGNWSIKRAAERVELSGGEVKEFPKGSVKLNAKYDFRFPWPEYRWPEGSL